METKYKLQLGVGFELNDIVSAVNTSLTTEYVIDELRDLISSYSADVDLNEIRDRFDSAIERSYESGFTSIGAWQFNKSAALDDLLGIVVTIDERLADAGIINASEVLSSFYNKLNVFVLNLSKLHIDLEKIDIADTNISSRYMISTIESLRLLDESRILSDLVSTELTFTPVDSSVGKNRFIDEKITTINEIIDSASKTFDDDYNRLISQINYLNDRLLDINYSNLTDGEKFEKARNLIKSLNPHRQLLDKLSKKITSASELKRQLTLHKKRLSENLVEETNSLDVKISANPNDADMYRGSLQGLEYVTESYASQIEVAIDRLTELEKKISNHYNVIDKIENSLKVAVPLEDEAKKYSSLAFKFRELSVKLEMAKSQFDKDNEKMEADKVAIAGLNALIESANDLKDLFIRHCMVMATFGATDAVIDFAVSEDAVIRLSQKKFLDEKLAEYSELNNSFNNDLATYRKVANNTIRDISIIMGKPFSVEGLVEISEIVEGAYNQLDMLLVSLDGNLNRQIDLLNLVINL